MGRYSSGAAIRMEFEGFRSLARAVDKEIPVLLRRAVIKSLRPAVEPMRRQMRIWVGMYSKTPIQKYSYEQKLKGGKGRLQKSIQTKQKTYRSSGVSLVVVGPRIDPPGFGLHGNIVERGSWKSGLRPHPITGTSGRMPSMPFVEPIADIHRTTISHRFRKLVEAEMTKWNWAH